jgi:hypothetical protein
MTEPQDSRRALDDWQHGRHRQPAVTNGYAIASLVLGIVWLWWLGSVLALVFGHTARNQINASDGRQSGEGLAIAGIVLGWIGIATFVWFALILGSLTTIIP